MKEWEETIVRKSDNKWFLSKIKQAVRRYRLLEPGDRVAVGLSGGKDSVFLLHVLLFLRQTSYPDLQLFPVHVDLGWEEDIGPLEDYCREHGVPLTREKTAIGDIVFKVREEPNPCALCAHLRRGALNNVALALGCTKVALGHHADDVLATFFLNLIYTGCLDTFLPRTQLSRSGLTVIRPLVYIPEQTIRSVAAREGLPVVKSGCPAAGRTKRAEMRDLVRELTGRYPDLYRRFLTAWESPGGLSTWGPLVRPADGKKNRQNQVGEGE
ncbi:MAG TPA: tRNA 2-thiocytidine biosynthesis protein TtcA [Firmicutes bacterium]|nr:tRNA 2-thiocytidine biosynthesis protein TtcA [Bacillota bacterium]